MNKRRVVITKNQNGRLKAFGSIKAACDYHNWPYNYLIKWKTPFEYKGFNVERLEITRAKQANY